ncbi:MFS transporter [Moraxella canis]|uniref:MFS transporter n=1 Tax=Moraxella canis TaxID=90239 RepID=A0ABZ0WZ23_9GAMM|nr:MFS transporter [Moraxella canis]WQE04410.1 MFS transporter [Moraxella canis]
MNETSSDSFAPLKVKVFLVMWLATILGNIGSFIRDVGSAWIMTDLSPSPMAVAMVQAAATLPIFLLAIPAGVLSDILDKRKFLIGIQMLMAFSSICLMLLSALGMQSVASLIALTFLSGIGVALMGPTWQAIVPELIDRSQLRNAVALNSLGINIARAIGPALGGLILASFGVAAAYGADVFSYVVVIAALIWWKRPVRAKDEMSESFVGAFKAGLRYAKASRELHIIFGRVFVYFVMASSVWALLPLVARTLLQGDARFYGIMLGLVGIGAIVGAVILPKIRARFSADQMLLCAAFITGLVMLALSASPPKAVALLLLLFLGVAWITALTTLNSLTQGILPNWVRGRALALYLMVFNGAMTLGSVIWGAVATQIGLVETLIASGICLLISSLLTYKIKLPNDNLDTTPSNHWAPPVVNTPIDPNDGPVMIQIMYQPKPEHQEAFLKTIYQLSTQRYKDGAYQWGIMKCTDEVDVYLEYFFVESWQEHMRQHQRVSSADAALQAQILEYLKPNTQPEVRHYLTARPNKA